MKNNRPISKMWIADQGDGTYRNPILYTDYSDPDVIRVGEEYYMVASSFCNAPGVPLLHSRDLVNWKVINYVIDRLPFDSYDRPRHGCGAWAPAIRYHDGLFYVFVPFPDEGIAVYTAEDPRGSWRGPQFVIRNAGWIDPCPFWDEDGTMYMVSGFAKSRIGFKSVLYLSVLRDEGDGLKAFTDEGGVIYDGHRSQPTIEGPKLYRRDGYYYIFAPAGGVKTGWQTVLRSRNILGPYEERIVMRQGGSAVNGPHQGAWVDTPDGEDWFIHFQDVGSAGRIIHLQPMRWQDGWPVIGEDGDTDGCGEPVSEWRKPRVRAEVKADAPEDSDLFEGDTLGLQWQWNANCERSWYEVGDGRLKLYAQPKEPETAVYDVPNLLLQKWPAPEFQATAELLLDGMKEGDICGMVSLGGWCDGLFVCLRDGEKRLQQRIGHVAEKTEERKDLGCVSGDRILIRMKVTGAERVSWEVSEDGEAYRPVGEATEAVAGAWVGVKAGLAAMHEGTGRCGFLQAESFIFQRMEGEA